MRPRVDFFSRHADCSGNCETFEFKGSSIMKRGKWKCFATNSVKSTWRLSKIVFIPFRQATSTSAICSLALIDNSNSVANFEFWKKKCKYLCKQYSVNVRTDTRIFLLISSTLHENARLTQHDWQSTSDCLNNKVMRNSWNFSPFPDKKFRSNSFSKLHSVGVFHTFAYLNSNCSAEHENAQFTTLKQVSAEMVFMIKCLGLSTGNNQNLSNHRANSYLTDVGLNFLFIVDDLRYNFLVKNSSGGGNNVWSCFWQASYMLHSVVTDDGESIEYFINPVHC